MTSFTEFADVIVKNGENVITTVVDNINFQPSGVTGIIRVRYKEGKL